MTAGTKTQSFDPIWEEKYASGHTVRAPWDIAVTFIFRFMPRGVARKDVKIFEAGCGPAPNLWFAAREGFSVWGLDGSDSAIAQAKKRFAEDSLTGQLEVGDFTKLPYEDSMFDLAIDRGSLTCCGTRAQVKAINEIHRVLKPGGAFLYTPFADTHESIKHGKPGPDDTIVDIGGGTLQNVGQLRFNSWEDITKFLPESKWKLEVAEYQEARDRANPTLGLHSAWKIVARKK